MNTHTTAKRLYNALEWLRSVLDKPRLETQQVAMLMKLIDLPLDGVSMQDLAAACPGASQSFISRNAQNFGAKSTGKRLLGMRISDLDIRYRMVHLTEDGRKTMNTFIQILEGLIEAPRTRPAVDRRTK